MTKNSSHSFDVIICGAGPAGCSAALALQRSGLNVALIEKKTFPRDKVCGDAIPARAVDVLKSIDPSYVKQFSNFDRQLLTKHTDIVYGKRSIKLHWQIPAYTCARVDFDNYLFSLVVNNTNTKVYQSTVIKDIQKGVDGYSLIDKSGDCYKAKMIIGADGAQGICAKLLGDYKLDREHHIGSVRAYFKGVGGMNLDKTEMYMDKSYRPGYFWLFPIAGGYTNVGFGMMSVDIAKRKIDLKKAFYDFIDKVPELRERFVGASLVGKLEGHSLPLASKRVVMSGEQFMLCGDAASLIDPITGEGIGNAMQSGYLAAMHAVECFNAHDFSVKKMKEFDTAVWDCLGKELGFRTRAQKLFRQAPQLLDMAFAISGWEPVRKLIQSKF